MKIWDEIVVLKLIPLKFLVGKRVRDIGMYVWTEPLRLNLLGPGNGHVTYLSRFTEPIPKNSL